MSLNPCFRGRGTARVRKKLMSGLTFRSLNPCFSGKGTARVNMEANISKWISLNPCFSGRCAASFLWRKRFDKHKCVLILVLMEDALREWSG